MVTKLSEDYAVGSWQGFLISEAIILTITLYFLPTYLSADSRQMFAYVYLSFISKDILVNL